MAENFKIDWIDLHRESQCLPNPDYPNGKDLDCGPIAPHGTCKVNLPYPAPRCGLFYVECRKRRSNAMITTAGRSDDPLSMKLPPIARSAAIALPSGPAFGVQPCVRPRIGAERQDYSAQRFGLAAPRKSSSGGTVWVGVQPFNGDGLEGPERGRYRPAILHARPRSADPCGELGAARCACQSD